MGSARALSPFAAIVLVGVLAGWIVTSVVGLVFQTNGLLGAGESPEARAYMIGLLERNPDSIAQLRPHGDIVQRAIEFQSAEQAKQTTMKPLSLTYLGGATMGRISVHIYAVGMRAANGRDQFFPLALTLVGGKVVRSE